MIKVIKPLGHKAYGSIPHLPGSRLGSGDHHCSEGQARIATEKARDKHDVVIVQEKLDGSCCAVAKINSKIIALGRAGYPARSSNYSVHHDFADWVEKNEYRFQYLLKEGERAVGEYLGQAVGTKYILPHEPFVIFDIMRGKERSLASEVYKRCYDQYFITPHTIGFSQPLSIQDAMSRLQKSGHGAVDPVEGAIWRVERNGKVDFLVKYVRHDKEDGKYFPEKNNGFITLNLHAKDLQIP